MFKLLGLTYALLKMEVIFAQPPAPCIDATGASGPCEPGREFCGAPFDNAPTYHLMDQHGCLENDPNGPSFDPVHGVIHHFYQKHLAAGEGHGPDYGHFVSKDFVHWAPLPVAIWNGLDLGYEKGADGYVTKYDNEAIFTGSAVLVDGAAPDGKSPGLVQIYPGLCNKDDWPSCGTGTLLAQAVPADYAGDALLTNWTKPSYNPIMENTQRDPSTPWKTPSGEWRLRTYDAKVYGAASDAHLLNGTWYEIGGNPDFNVAECPSLYPLPATTAGLPRAANGPTHVHKTSYKGKDWWQMGTYTPGQPGKLGGFTATPGWEDVFDQRIIDAGAFYASKDNLYPTKVKGTDRRINWGWSRVSPGSTQSLPREISFNPEARQLQQLPIEEVKDLRKASVYSQRDIELKPDEPVPLKLSHGVAKTSEIVATFALPSEPVTFGVALGSSDATPYVSTYMAFTDLPGDDYNVTHMPSHTNPRVCENLCGADDKCVAWTYVVRGTPPGSGDCCLKDAVPCPSTTGKNAIHCTSGVKVAQSLPGCKPESSAITCQVEWSGANASAPFVDVPVSCGDVKDTLRVLTSETSVELRIFADVTFQEVFFQQGRIAMTVENMLNDETDYSLTATGGQITVKDAEVWPMTEPWVSADDVRNAPRVFQ